jgi:hypothetical protein
VENDKAEYPFSGRLVKGQKEAMASLNQLVSQSVSIWSRF